MRHITISFLGMLLGISGLWFMADSLWPQPLTYFSFRFVFNQYSGVIAMAAMSACMVLAVRPVWLENWLNGLDKGYRLHKWLGIVALVSALTHFWFTKGTKWMVGWGWLVRPERGGRPQGVEVQGIEQWLGGLRGVAEGVGEWTFYAAAVLMVVALVKRVPYHWFARLHTWLALTYLALVFHAVVLIKFAYWTQPIGWVMGALMAAGTVSALLILLRRMGRRRRHPATINALHPYPQVGGFAVELAAPEWPGHVAGQFAFLRLAGSKEAHPFTLASAWDAQYPTIRFFIKQLGDYTEGMAARMRIGDTVELEGPYGRFTFTGDRPQIWIAAGIGITPFLARLDALAQAGGSAHPVTLLYSYREADADFLAALQRSAQAAGVRALLWPSSEKGRLDGAAFRALLPQWREADVWFCGGVDFARSLKRDLRAHGLQSGRFHQELFAMR